MRGKRSCDMLIPKAKSEITGKDSYKLASLYSSAPTTRNSELRLQNSRLAHPFRSASMCSTEFSVILFSDTITAIYSARAQIRSRSKKCFCL